MRIWKYIRNRLLGVIEIKIIWKRHRCPHCGEYIEHKADAKNCWKLLEAKERKGADLK